VVVKIAVDASYGLYGMSMLKIQRYCLPGKEFEFGDVLVVIFILSAFIESDIEAALDYLIASTTNLTKFLQLSDDGSQAEHFCLRFGESEAIMRHEREFWVEAVRFSNLHEKIAHYAKQVNDFGPTDSFQDEAHARGAFAISELLLADARWCMLFGELLFQWDMDHETFQEVVIEVALRKHRLSDDTIELLACRTMAGGQNVDTQVATALHLHGFATSMNLDQFAERCASKLPKSPCPEILLNDFASTYANGDFFAFDIVWQAFQRAGISLEHDDFKVDRSIHQASLRTVCTTAHWDDDFKWSIIENLNFQELIAIA